jgi:hypothetical protein
MINQIQFPVILYGVTHEIDLVSNKLQLTRTTTLGYKRKSLHDCIIFDSKGQFYRVIRVNKTRNLYPWWRFEFFNPFIEIDLTLERLKDYTIDQAKQNVISSVNRYPDYWENEYEIQTVIEKINECSTMAELIAVLFKIRHIETET